MDSTMTIRTSALVSEYNRGRFGTEGKLGITMGEVPDLQLSQVAFWPDSFGAVGDRLAKDLGCDGMPGPGQAVVGENGVLIRTEPLKLWLFGAPAPDFDAAQAVTLDLSHSRTHLRVSGEQATILLNRFLPLDLREDSFPIDSVASTAFHHVGVTLWRSGLGYDLFIPRNFALSLWQMLKEGAAQFGYQVA